MNTPSWIESVVADIKTLSKNEELGLNAGKFEAVHAIINNQTLDREQLQSMMQQMNNVVGWVQATSEVKTLDSEPIQVNSTLLNGEWITVSDNNIKTSYLLEYIGNYEWSLQSCQIDLSNDKASTHLAEYLTHREVGASNKRSLVYQKLWSLRDTILTAEMAFFIGFDS